MLSLALLVLQGAVVQGDDGEWLREAKRAQSRFEMVRRAQLPMTLAAASRRCDARIGRYCYWYDATETKPREPPRISDARAELLVALDSLAAGDEDGWIAGQRVRYLLESDRTADALMVARDCRSERWRCAAYEGLALHVGERYAEADSVFALALREMSPERRCEWLDLRQLVARELARELSRAGCDERAALAHRLFELSQPLWSVTGNDLRTEHLARLTMAEIFAQSANAHGMTWSADSRELLVRYGWPEWYTRHRYESAGLYEEPRVSGHDRQPSYHWFPDVPDTRAAARLDTTSWRLRDSLARSRYAPRHLERLADLPHQLARFPRGDSMLVAAVFAVRDTALARDTLTAWFMTRAPDAAAVNRARGERGALLANVPDEPFIASIEVRGRASSYVARARYTVDQLSCRATRWCLSDLLLFTPSGDSVSGGLQAALATASADMRFSRRAPLGVLWQLQTDASVPQPVWLGLTVSRVRVSAVRRLASRLKLAPAIAPIRIRWQAMLTSSADTQHVVLRLPASASGHYRVELTAEAAGAPTLMSSRDIEVRQ